jgi:hypothetical protein
LGQVATVTDDTIDVVKMTWSNHESATGTQRAITRSVCGCNGWSRQKPKPVTHEAIKTKQHSEETVGEE